MDNIMFEIEKCSAPAKWMDTPKGPYIFISYSHSNSLARAEVCRLFEENNVRYWYDDGLHSGDDWNMVIAKNLQQASACLLLLSKEASESEYVKNELTFAMNRRIPIHVLVIGEFQLPIDLEMMLGRMQMIKHDEDGQYIWKLVRAFPPDVVMQDSIVEKKQHFEHPLFRKGDLLYERQGTYTYQASHKMLSYPCILQEERIGAYSKEEVLRQAKLAASLKHPLFPQIYDMIIEGERLYIWLEDRKEQFFTKFMEEHKLSPAEIENFFLQMVDGMDYLEKNQLTMRTFPRGSLMVQGDNRIGLTRMYHLFYGPIKTSFENRTFYFEEILQELAYFLYMLCTGEEPILPVKMMESDDLPKTFLRKMNLIVQKSTRENKHAGYASFDEIKEDMKKDRISFADEKFLKKREKKLDAYYALLNTRRLSFSGHEVPMGQLQGMPNVEESFGFDSTVVLGTEMDGPAGQSSAEAKACFSIRICDTGEIHSFNKDTIVIGRDREQCDMWINQFYLSRLHARVQKRADGKFIVSDLGSSNGTFCYSGSGMEHIRVIDQVVVKPGSIISIGKMDLQLLV